MWHAYVNNPRIFVQKKPQSICTLVTRGTLFRRHMWSHLFLSARPICGHSRASFCPRIVCPFQTEDRKYVGRILYEPSPRERGFFEVLQSSFCFSQILCYEADKSQILVRNASLKGPQSAFSVFKHEGDFLNKGISLYTLNIQYLIKIFKHQGYFKNRHWVHIPPTIFCQH